MITYKQINKDERLAIKTVSKFWSDHSLVIYTIIIPILFILMFASWTIIMMLAAVGGGAIEKSFDEQFASGQITTYQYNVDMKIMDIVAWDYNFWIVLARFAIGAIILLLLYVGFKEYLKYKRDYL